MPFSYVKRTKTTLAEMKPRLAVDIYRGILLEVVKRMVVDLQEKFVEDANRTSDYLLIALANLAYIRREFFEADTTENLASNDLPIDTKTEEGLWSLL